VFVDGAVAGSTPFTWRSGKPDRSYTVKYRLDGYRDAKGSLDGLARGETKAFSLTLSKGAAAPGKLKVRLAGGAAGWANVYVDGKNMGRAPGAFDLAAGTYDVRIENPEVGLDYTEKVVIGSGSSKTVTARL
jgi:hypothetical protein